jgi:hypothetical protein
MHRHAHRLAICRQSSGAHWNLDPQLRNMGSAGFVVSASAGPSLAQLSTTPTVSSNTLSGAARSNAVRRREARGTRAHRTRTCPTALMLCQCIVAHVDPEPHASLRAVGSGLAHAIPLCVLGARHADQSKRASEAVVGRIAVLVQREPVRPAGKVAVTERDASAIRSTGLCATGSRARAGSSPRARARPHPHPCVRPPGTR